MGACLSSAKDPVAVMVVSEVATFIMTEIKAQLVEELRLVIIPDIMKQLQMTPALLQLSSATENNLDVYSNEHNKPASTL